MTFNYWMRFNLALIYIVLFSLVSSCKKLASVDAPDNRITSTNVYNSDATASAVLTGLYADISSASSLSNGLRSLSMYAGLSADELALWGGSSNQSQIMHYTNTLTSQSAGGFMPWQNLYIYIYTCNSAIEGVNGSSSLTPAVKQQLLGEAKFMRALFYFFLVNLYGDVPLALSTDYKHNSALFRSSQAEVYQQIIEDLIEAQSLLSNDYLKVDALTPYPIASAERIRPNKWAATALLARTYLYYGDYANAELQSTEVLNNTAFYGLTNLDSTYLKNSREAIWQLQPTNSGYNTEDARLFIIGSTGPNANTPVFLSNSLIKSFEPDDQRKNKKWIDSVTVSGSTYYFPYKYKVNVQNSSVTSPGKMSEYLMMLRLSEQYLIRAEARAQLNKVLDAKSDLNLVRKRAGLLETTVNDKTSILAAIIHERQVELFTEWGHRWLDLKRLGVADAVMAGITPGKGGSWETKDKLYPLPSSELERNPNLIQNPGY